MLSWLQRLMSRAQPSALPAILVDDTGFSLTLNGHARAFPWQSVRKVAAFKQDLHTYDRIVLLIEVSTSGDPVLVLSEDCPGFASLFGPMEGALGINPSWYLEIMTPVFEPTPVALYVRPDPESPASGDEQGDR